jgi:hypothetical protein
MASSNVQNRFTDFLNKNGDLHTKDFYWKIEEQILEMWSAEVLDVLENIREFGNYAEIYIDLDYKRT